jgi:predicted ArsR family transcriptional regulator
MSCDRRDHRKQILDLTRTRGPFTTTQLASCLGVTTTAIRRHLLSLEQEGLLFKQNRRGNVGRPSQVWDLTRVGRRAFHDAHAEFCVRLIESVRQVWGADGLQAVLDAMAREDAGEVAAHLGLIPTREARVRALVALRREQGYMAEYGRDPETGADLLIENHCPVEDAARSCGQVCDQELSMLSQVMGDDVSVVRMEHLLDGDRRCVYGIHPPAGLDV